MRLLYPLFHFEAPEDGGGGAPAAVADPAPAEPVSAAEPAATQEPAGEAWVPSREEWEEQQAYLQGLARYVQQIGQPQPQGQPEADQGFQLPPPPDPWADDYADQVAARDQALLGQFGQMMQQALGQYVGPIQTWAQEQQLAEGEARAEDIFDDLISREGDLPVPKEQAFEVAHAMANAMLPELSERYGWGPRAAEVALERSVAQIRSLLDAAGNAAVERYKNQLSGLSGAPSEPGGEGAAAQVIGGERPDSLKELARRLTTGVTA